MDKPAPDDDSDEVADLEDTGSEDPPKTIRLNLDRARPKFSRTSADWVSVAEYMRWESGETTPAEILRSSLERRGEPPPSDEEVAAFEKSMVEQSEATSKVLKEASQKLARNMAPLFDASNLLGIKPDTFVKPLPPPVVDPGLTTALSRIRNPVVDSLEGVANAQALSNQLLDALVNHVVDSDHRQEQRDERVFQWARATAILAGLTLLATVAGILLAVFT